MSNINIQLEKDYFGQNKKALFSFFKNFNNYDLISFFEENGIQIIEEDRGRLILKSGNSRELLEFLLKKSKENNTKIFLEQSVIDIKKT
ncbi:MAG: NAD(P)/FAD-dependent oxidoreductase [Candidatus Peribacteria bacterium]|nr:NAD(P)/FAD-dependent oxidoreductase [Candidatus Peribacteria bacterium]